MAQYGLASIIYSYNVHCVLRVLMYCRRKASMMLLLEHRRPVMNSSSFGKSFSVAIHLLLLLSTQCANRSSLSVVATIINSFEDIVQWCCCCILHFRNRKILLADEVQRAETHHCAKFHQNSSIRCKDIVIFFHGHHLGFVCIIFGSPTERKWWSL